MIASAAIDPQTSLPDLFQAHPETRAIFNRYGLRGCGGANGPNESLAFFAAAHGVDLPQLLQQIHRVISDPLARQQAATQLRDDARPRLADAIYRPYFLTAMALMLTAGAAWGAMLLWKIGLTGSFTAVSVHEVNAHGHAQIMGWVGLFIMGFAYQAFPRMWHVDLPAPRLAVAAFIALLLAIAARSTAMMLDPMPISDSLQWIGAGVETAAVIIFISQLLLALSRSHKRIEPYVGFILAALAFLLLQTLLSGWHTARLMSVETREALLAQIATYQAPLRDIQIHGLALLMILGVGIRMFPAIFGLPEVSARRAWSALAILLSAVTLEVSLFLAYRWTGNHAIAGALLLPWLLLPIGVGLIVWPWRLWRPLPEPARHDRSGKFLRIAFAWLFLSFTMLLLLPVYQVISGIAFSHAYYGAIRHAITVGFISMMIVGMSAKVAPTLRGIGPERLPALWLPFVLLNLGCLLRVVLQTLTDWDDVYFRLVGVSGMLEWTALAIWAGHLSMVMMGLGRYRQDAGEVENPGDFPAQIEQDHRVAAVLHWHPELEPVFIAHGFDLIRNPVLRRTIARTVSLRQACAMKGVDLQTFLSALNSQRIHRH